MKPGLQGLHVLVTEAIACVVSILTTLKHTNTHTHNVAFQTDNFGTLNSVIISTKDTTPLVSGLSSFYTTSQCGKRPFYNSWVLLQYLT